ncbi:MAG: RNA methyltransferase [Endomicrobium sp.]|jgi:TrmH family RNA methyltransferase|nr:RNA methyltransferase [Endomicrobium sp.]
MIIESAQNKIFKEALSLNDKKKRDDSGLFLVEGKKQIAEIPADWNIRRIFVSKDYKEKPSVKNVFILHEKLFNKLASTQSPQGIIAEVEKKNYNIEKIIKQDGFFIILETIQDPGNLGTIIRSARAFGAKGVFVSKDSADIYSDKTARSAMGALFNIAVIDNVDCGSLISIMKKENIKIFAASLKGKEITDNAIFKGKTALIIGNEANGIKPETQKAADALIKIPMIKEAESLNAAIAASILMYEAAMTK